MSARNLALSALFVGPIAAFADQWLSYVLVYGAQASGSKAWLHVVSLVTALAAIAGIVMAARALSRRNETAEVDRFLGVAGVAVNAFFLLVIVGFAIPKFLQGVSD